MTFEPANFERVKLAPARLNLVDMINTVGRASVPATMFYDIDMTCAEALRSRFEALGQKITVTAVLLKSIAIAQRKHPATRTIMLPNGGLIQLNKIEAQFTVERFVDGGPALFFGTIKDPETKPLSEITRELHRCGTEPIENIPQLAIQSRFSKYPSLIRQIILFIGMRVPKIRIHYMGATFGFSSLGKYGCKSMISPSVITSMFCAGQVVERPIAVEGKVEIHPMLTLVLNFDHRVLDGATSARFINDIIDLLLGGLEKHVAEELELLETEQRERQTVGEIPSATV